MPLELKKKYISYRNVCFKNVRLIGFLTNKFELVI